MSSVQTQTLLIKIRERGYWGVVIRPASFNKTKIDYSTLAPLIEQRAVRLRGWPYPAVSQGCSCKGPDWVGRECDWNHFVETWRFHQSGQFIHYFGIPLDWLDQSSIWRRAKDWRWGQALDYIDTLFTLTEIFEFAGRLAMSEAGAPLMHVEIEINGLKDRRLTDSGTGIFFSSTDHYQCRDLDQWKWSLTEPQTTLIAEARLLAAKAARDLFARFDADVSVEILKTLQESIGRFRS